MSQIIRDCRERKQLVRGPKVEAFEQEFARFLGGTGHVKTCSTEYGRHGALFRPQGHGLPPGSEIIVPALHLLGGAGNDARRRPHAGVCRHRSGDVHAESGRR
jgi:Predicted pyridoxal phosphate-dependent enzyme apparently involved in regulation of cell wall biogenesis